MSPYIFLSNGRLNASLLKHLYTEKHSIASIVWGHDTSYFVPKIINNVEKHYFEFDLLDKKHKIPLFPINRGQNESVEIYEIIHNLKPDVLITIGDLSDHLYIKALKTFCTNEFKWLSILTTYQNPINEEHLDLIQYADAVMCTSPSSYQNIKDHFIKDEFEWSFVGSDFEYQEVKSDGIISIGKNCQSDNLFGIMQIAQKVDENFYFHTNVHDLGEINLEKAKNLISSNNIYFPDKYVSLFDGLKDSEMQNILSSKDLFLSNSMTSGTAMACFDAISCGCFPVLIDSPCHVDVAIELEKHLNGKCNKDDFLMKSIKLLTTGETYLHIGDIEDGKNKIDNFMKKHKNDDKIKKELISFTRKYTNCMFNDKITKMISKINKNDSVLWLEK